MLAAELVPKYRYENCAVVALSDGGVMVGAQIAMQLHCVITMLLSAEIKLPRELDAIAGITVEGNLAYNHRFSQGEIDEMTAEYFNFIEQEKRVQMHEMNQLLGSGGLIDKKLLRGHTIILVSDGMASGFQLDLAAEFLKPIEYDRLVVAVPLASVQAVDRMHVLADEIHCPSVVEYYMDTDHYYDRQDIPDHATIIKTIEHIILEWK